MNSRIFTILNLIGVLAIAGFCGYQWKTESRLNREVNDLLRTKHAHETKIAEHEKTIEGLTGDLTLFKNQFAAAKEELAETYKTLHKAESDNARLTQERDQLKANIEVWKEAVKERDEHIAEANARLKEFAEKINEGVRRYNELAQKHNEMVALVNSTRQELAQAYKDLDDARRKLYKALGQKVPEPKKPQPPADEPKKEAKPAEGAGA